MRDVRLWLVLAACAFGACVCQAPIPPKSTLSVLGTGVFVGEVYTVDAPLGGATIEVIGTAMRATSAEGKQFTLYPVPVGEHTVAIRDEASGRAARFQATLPTENVTITLPAADTTLLEPSTVSGSVRRSDSESVAGALVFIVGGTSGEVVPVDGDGNFEVKNVPPGQRTLAASLPGYDVAQVEIDLVAGQGLVLTDALVLTELGTTDAVEVRGKVIVADDVEYAGTLVVADDGVAVGTTNDDGEYELELTPGLHVLRATRSGYAAVTLPTVSVSADGEVDGLVDMYLSASANVDVLGVELEVRAPLPGTTVASGAPVVLAADLDNAALNPSLSLDQVEWSWRRAGEIDYQPLGAGDGITVTFTEAVETDIELQAAIPAANLVANSSITVVPLFAAQPAVGFSVVNIDVPDLVDTDADGDFDLSVSEGIPIQIVAAGSSASLAVVWQDPVAVLSFVNTLPVGSLQVGTYRFTASVETPDGLAESATIELVINPLQFTVSIAEPASDTIYFSDGALPLRAIVTHDWQIAFDVAQVRWLREDGTLLANGSVTSSLNAPLGSNILLLQVVDAAGNTRSAFADYQRSAVTFTATVEQPSQNFQVQQGQPVPFRVSFAHSRVPQNDPDVVVRLFSDRDGLLTVTDGAAQVQQFAPGDTVTTSTLSPGTHLISARVIADGAIATATTTVTVLAPFVTAVRTLPLTNLVLAIDGTPMNFAVAAVSAPGTSPKVSWYLDGIEFASGWGGYGTDPLAASRLNINLGSYDPAVAPFTDPRWSGGVDHTISAWVRLQGAEDGGITQCVNAGASSKCLSFTVRVFDQLTERPSEDITGLQVWEGANLLTGNVRVVSGGQLIIAPGSTIVVDGQASGSYERSIELYAGTLLIGETDPAPTVTFAMREGGTITSWSGISASSNGPGHIEIRNALIQNADSAVSLAGLAPADANHTYVVENVTVERSSHAFTLNCPDAQGAERIASGLVARNLSGTGLTLREAAGCPPTPQTFSGVEVSNAALGLSTTFSGLAPWTLDALDLHDNVTGISTNVVSQLTIQNSTITRNTAYGVAAAVPAGATLRLTQSSLVDNNLATYITGTGTILVDQNSFADNQYAIATGLGVGANAHVHANELRANVVDIDTGYGAIDIHAEGNDFGDPNDPTSTAGFLADSGAAVLANAPRIIDALDFSTGPGVVALANRVFNQRPVAVIEEPKDSALYHPDLCIPLLAHAPPDGVDVQTCTWRVFTPGSDPLAGTTTTPAADGCLDLALPDGDHGIALTCTDDAVTTTQSTIIRVDGSRYAGRLRGAGLTLSGTVSVDGDLIVPAGATLTLLPGTTVEAAFLSDSTRHADLRQDGAALGRIDRVEIHVAGTLSAVGAAGQRIVLLPETGAAANSWGGIVALEDAVVQLEQVDVRASRMVVQSELLPASPFTHADVSLVDVAVEETGVVIEGACGALLDGVTVTGYDQILSCASPADIDVLDLTVSGQRGGYTVFNVSLAAGAPPVDLRITGGSLTSANGVLVSLSGVASFDMIGTSLDGVSSVGNTGTAPLFFSDLTVTNFVVFMPQLFNSASPATVDHSTFQDGASIVYGYPGALTFTRNRVTNVAHPFDVLQPDYIAALDVNGNLFDGSDVVFRYQPSNAGSPAAFHDLSGNDFTGSTTVLALMTTNVQPDDGPDTQYRITNSFFGPAFVARAVIEANKIIDGRTDANPNDDIVGNTDFGGFLSSPPALDLP